MRVLLEVPFGATVIGCLHLRQDGTGCRGWPDEGDGGDEEPEEHRGRERGHRYEPPGHVLTKCQRGEAEARHSRDQHLKF